MVKKQLNEQKDSYVVGIGASAGGLEAIHEFFDNFPSDTDFSFVIIQHLSSDYKSLLAELLTKHTSMEVFEAEDEMVIKPNSVYVIPNKSNIVLSGNKLKFVNKATHAPNNAIDVFFKSLAEEKKNKAIGIILSGTGTDGSKGLGLVKKNGGLAVVQDPVTAKFDGMPNSAISSNHIDLILPPELMPEALINQIKRSSGFLSPSGKLPEEEEEIVNAILDLIRKVTHCDFSSYKRATIMRRLTKRMNMSNIKDLRGYLEYLITHPEEVDAVSKEFLIGVTRFFRDEEAFAVVEEKVIPEIFAEKDKNDLIKVWVAGCSTGEEAYSLAILFDEYLSKSSKQVEVKIFASDIDAESIEIASKGIYPSSIGKDLTQGRLDKYFIWNGKSYQVNPHIRKMVIFAHHDLIKDPPFGKIDLLTCRNLLIYLNAPLQKKILSIFNFSLNLNGFIFLGASETPAQLADYLSDISKKWKIYRKVKLSNQNSSNHFTAARFSLDHKPVKFPVSFVNKRSQHNDLMEMLADTMMDDFGYAGVFINEHYELIQAVGDFKKYLELPDKRLNLNLLKMVPAELSTALNTIIRKTVKMQKKSFVKGVKFKDKKTLRSVNLMVKPFFNENKLIPKVILILFSDNMEICLENQEYEEYNLSLQKSDQVAELESELKETKELLQATVEEQETANEELQSANEELISANEELQSTNEELQSLNEELHTVNTEHQLKIKELIELNDDLNNYFKSTDIGQVFVDSNFIIRKFTPAIKEQINLIEGDIGRSLIHISNNLGYENLQEEIEQVIKSNISLEREIRTLNGKWYLMRMFPYVRQDKETDGAVITFVDITNLKELNSIVSSVINSTTNKIIALKAIRDKKRIIDFQMLLVNNGAEKFLGIKEIQIQGVNFSKTRLSFSIPDLIEKLSSVVEYNTNLRYEYFDEEKNTWYDIIGVKMDDGAVLTFSDITDKKESENKIRFAFEEIKVAREKLQKLNKELESRVEERTRELSLSEERFRIISLATNDVIRDWDLTNNKVWWNNGIQSHFGYRVDEINKTIEFWQENIHPDEREVVVKNLSEKINKGINQWSEEYRFRKADGSYAYVLDRGSLMVDGNGIPYRMISSMVDVSDLKKVERELKETNSNLMKINTDLDNFIYTASHDLKAPISNIEGLVYSLTDVVDVQSNDELKTIVELINDSILKFKKTIKDLTEITRLQKELFEENGKANVVEILEEVKQSIKDLINSNNAVITEQIETREIGFSRKNLRSIIYNLLSNAVKYRSPKRAPRVTVSSYISDNNFILVFSDNGLGIEKSKQDKVFSMFKRFHDHVDGSGVGMYIVKRIVDNAGGKIELESEPDKGTTFRVILPVDNN